MRASASSTRLLGPIAFMCAVVVASNILVQFPFAHFGLGELLTWGAFTYPLAFLATDLTNRRFGPAAARRVVYVGFALAVVLSIWLASPRIALASGTAFLVAQLFDVGVFSALRRRAWWVAPLVSTMLGAVIDTALFFSLAFADLGRAFWPLSVAEPWAQDMVALPLIGLAGPLWVSLAIGDLVVKWCVGLAALIPYRLLAPVGPRAAPA